MGIKLGEYLESVNVKMTGRVTEIFKKLIRKELGQVWVSEMIPITSGGKKLWSVMYTLADGRHRIQLNWQKSTISSKIYSINVWIRPSADPAFQAKVDSIPMVGIWNLIKDLIKRKKIGEYEVAINEDVKLDEKIDCGGYLEGFENVIGELLGTTNIDSFSDFNEASSFEDDKYKAQDEYDALKGITKKEDPNIIQKRAAALKKLRNARRTLKDYKASIKVTKGKPQEMQSTPKERDEFSALFDDPMDEAEAFAMLESSAKDIQAGRINALLVLGTAGIGKTYTVESVFKKEIKSGVSVVKKGSITSAAALYKELFVNNDPKKTIILDDLDTLFSDRDSSNILKGALDSGEKREISYLSQNNVPPSLYKILINPDYDVYEFEETIKALKEGNDEMSKDYNKRFDKRKFMRITMGEIRSWCSDNFDRSINPFFIKDDVWKGLAQNKVDLSKLTFGEFHGRQTRAADPYKGSAVLPNTFEFTSKIIFISNLFINNIPGAISSRCAMVELDLNLEQIVNRIGRLLPNIKFQNATDSHKRDAFEFLKNVVLPSGRIDRIDFRTFSYAIVRNAMSGAPKNVWYKWAAVELKKKLGGPASKVR